MPPITPCSSLSSSSLLLRRQLLHSYPRIQLASSKSILALKTRHTSPRRSFHASPRVQSVDLLLNGSQAALETLHAVTGTSWAVTIPLAAVLIRATILLPITLYQRNVIKRQATLSPLVHGWINAYMKDDINRARDPTTGIVSPSFTRAKSKQDEIYKRWGCQSWKSNFAPLTQLPIWLVMVESLRRMCGANEGLLMLMAKSGEYVGIVSKEEDFATTHTAISASAESLTAAVETATQSVHLVPDFATGGALWFPDLLAADPYLALPFILSGSILLNLFGKTSWHKSSAWKLAPTTWRGRLVRSMGVVALAIGPLTLQVPAGMLIYWISSSLGAYVQAVVLDRYVPIQPYRPKREKYPLMVMGKSPDFRDPALKPKVKG